MKIHISLATSRLDESVRFYSALLDAEPTKVLPDYALFVTERPGLELALQLDGTAAVGTDAHYGVLVESVAEVDAAIARLSQASLVSSIEREETCCYASQTKVWAVDPEGRRWEVYTVHEEADTTATPAACCA